MFVFEPKKIKRIKTAMSCVDRINFVPSGAESEAYQDHPLPIGFGQTISQPTTVEYMLYWLDPQPGHKVLDLGCGSGWTSAMLAKLVEDEKLVTAVDRIAELASLGQNNCINAGYTRINFQHNQQSLGWPDNAPYDRILVSAAAREKIPTELVEQLAPNGKLVIPVDSSIYEMKLDQQCKLAYCHEHYGFIFVPLIHVR